MTKLPCEYRSLLLGLDDWRMVVFVIVGKEYFVHILLHFVHVFFGSWTRYQTCLNNLYVLDKLPDPCSTNWMWKEEYIIFLKDFCKFEV